MAKLLLVEDDNNLREIYQARLQAEGYDIVAAQDGEEALVVAKKEKPDLIISDVMMPRISGFEMLDILRNTDGLKDTKVIMLTALGQADDQSRADNLGADRYLVKSQVTLEDIVKAAKELLGELPEEEPTPPVSAPEPTVVQTPVAVEPVAVATAPDEQAPSEPVTPPAPVADPTAVPTPDIAPVTQPVVTTPVPEVAPVAPVVETPPSAPEPVVAPPAPLAADTPTTSVADPAQDATPAVAPVAAEAVTAPQSVPETVSTEPLAPVAPAPEILEPAQPAVPEAPAVSEPVAAPTVADPIVVSAPSIEDSSDAATQDTPADPALALDPSTAVVDEAAQTLADEEKAIEEQIKNFESEPGIDPTEAAPQTEVEAQAEAEVAVAPTPEVMSDAEVNDTAVLENAVEQLQADEGEQPALPPSQKVVPGSEPVAEPPQPATEPATVVEEQPNPTPAPEAVATPPAESASENVPVAGKKIIQPINSNLTSGPNLEALLAKEAASAPAAPAQPVVGGGTPQQQPKNPHEGLDPTIVSL